MKVLLSGGGTAGHITPLLAVAKELHGLDPETIIEFIGQSGDTNVSIAQSDMHISKIHTVQAGKFRRFHSLTLLQNILNLKVNLLNLRDFFKLCVGFVQSILLLVKIRPDVIFFKGGFVVVPIGFAARLLRVPYMTHDSDALPGLANRLIAKGAKFNAVANKHVTAYPSTKTVIAGIPLVEEYSTRSGVSQKKYKLLLGFPDDSLVLFVYTGTRGARVIDDALDDIVPRLLKKYERLHVAIVFGRLNEDSFDRKFTGLSVSMSKRVRKLKFIQNAYDYIAAADVIIGRAGATTMAEFATVGRATILIPATAYWWSSATECTDLS